MIDVKADVAYAALGLTQKEHRPLDAAPLEVAVRRLAEGGPEGPDEVRLGDVGDLRKGRDVERPRVVAVHGVARAKHPAVGLFDRPAHRGGKSLEIKAQHPSSRAAAAPRAEAPLHPFLRPATVR